jgi:hypothetical protein
MNMKFLYKKAYPIGFLNDEDDHDRLAFWMEDDSQEKLSKKFRECPIGELIIELIDIFRGGCPNYGSLINLFGFIHNEEECNEYFNEKIIIKKYNGIKRIVKDIASIHIYIESMNDKTLVIRKLFLNFTNLPPIEELKQDIFKAYSDLCYEESEGLTIFEKECEIYILLSSPL